MKGTDRDVISAIYIKKDFLDNAFDKYDIDNKEDVKNLTTDINNEIAAFISVLSPKGSIKFKKRLRKIKFEEVRHEYIKVMINEDAETWIIYKENEEDIKSILFSKFLRVLFGDIL